MARPKSKLTTMDVNNLALLKLAYERKGLDIPLSSMAVATRTRQRIYGTVSKIRDSPKFEPYASWVVDLPIYEECGIRIEDLGELGVKLQIYRKDQEEENVAIKKALLAANVPTASAPEKAFGLDMAESVARLGRMLEEDEEVEKRQFVNPYTKALEAGGGGKK